MTINKNSFEGFRGLVCGLPSLGQSQVRISIVCFVDDKFSNSVSILEIANSVERSRKLHEYIEAAVKRTDPILAQFLSAEPVEKNELHFYIGDPDEELEDFIDENADQIELFLQEHSCFLLGGLVVTQACSELILHLSQNYFLVSV